MSNLPARPSLDSLRKQAKSLLSSFLNDDPDAIQRVRTHHPRPDAFSSLRDAQLVVAREYGYPGWSELTEAVDAALDAVRSIGERADLFADLACLCYSSDESSQRRIRAAQLLADAPELTHEDVYAAAAAADVDALVRIIEQDPGCVNCEGGARNWPPLMYATYSRAQPGDAVATVRALLDAGADAAYYVDGTSPSERASIVGGWHWTALTGAVGEGEGGLIQQSPHPQAVAIAEMLLDAGATANDSQGLYNSIFIPDNSWIEMFLERGLGPGDRVVPGDPSQVRTLDYILVHAVKNGFVDRVRLLLAHGADATASDETYTGRPMIAFALEGGYGEILDLLVDHGAARPDLSDADRYRIAVVGGDVDAAKALLEADSALAQQPGLLIKAAHHGDVDCLGRILDLGCDPNALNSEGRGALHEAAWKGNLEVARVLIERGARCEIRSEAHDATPVGYANHASQRETRDFLLEHTHDVYDLVRFRRTARLREVIGISPAGAREARSNGMTALHIVPDMEDAAEVVDLLLGAGADIDARDGEGKTPLASAMAGEREGVAGLLKERGAGG